MTGNLTGVTAAPLPVRLLAHINDGVRVVSMLALLAACGVLTTSVVLRYFLHVPTDWQDEVAVFLLVGATFLSAGGVQARRGHIGIEALASVLPAAVDRLRRRACDVASLAFCAFFTWKSWALLHEAWTEGQTTSSSWAPPLWIPYGLMTVGMLLLSVQLLAQVLQGPDAGPRPAGHHGADAALDAGSPQPSTEDA